MKRLNLDKLADDLEQAAEMCVAAGTPFSVRRKFKAAILAVAVLKEAVAAKAASGGLKP